MKLFVILLAVVATVALADSSQLGHLGQVYHPAGPSTDDTMCSQPFDFGTLQNGLGCNSANSWRLADDFENTIGQDLATVEIWMIFTGSGATQYNFAIYEDGGTGPSATAMWSNGETAITNTDTGLSNWGYAIWYSMINLDNAVAVPASTKYWWSVQTESSSTDYCLASDQMYADEMYFSQDNGASWSSSTANWGAPYELYMILEGVDALDRCTWGEIKAVF